MPLSLSEGDPVGIQSTEGRFSVAKKFPSCTESPILTGTGGKGGRLGRAWMAGARMVTPGLFEQLKPCGK